MGTRSVIAVPLDNGFKGRYCHWDGYPSGVGAQLLRIVGEHGVSRAREILTEEHYGWSNLTDTPTLGLGYDDGRFAAVPGVGVAYTTEKGQSSPEQWITNEDVDTWCEWGYVLNDTHLSVLKEEYGKGWTHVGDVPYDAPDQLGVVESAAYADEDKD